METLPVDHALALDDLRENAARLANGERSREDERRARDRSVAQAHASGVPTAAIADVCGISGTMVRRIVQLARERGQGVEL